MPLYIIYLFLFMYFINVWIQLSLSPPPPRPTHPLYIIKQSPAHHANMAFGWGHPDLKSASKVERLSSNSHSRLRTKGPWKALTFMCFLVPVNWDIWKAVLGLLFWEAMCMIEGDRLQYILSLTLFLPCSPSSVDSRKFMSYTRGFYCLTGSCGGS